MYTSMNDAYAAAFSIALDRLTDAGVHPDSIKVSLDRGDGAVLYAITASHSVTVHIGGAAADLDDPYYKIQAVESTGL